MMDGTLGKQHRKEKCMASWLLDLNVTWKDDCINISNNIIVDIIREHIRVIETNVGSAIVKLCKDR